ncbi:MAG: Hsp20/alpha crystallin family protein [Burkholderiaceae bacterium]
MDPFKHLRSELERNIVRAWDRLSEGWRELLSRSGAALTHFAKPATGMSESEAEAAQSLPTWSLLSADVWETAKSVIVRVEIPGMEKEDFDIAIHGGELRIRGEKRSKRDRQERLYHLMERAYGNFERRIALPHSIDSAQAEVSYQGGVLTVILPKTEDVPPQQLDVR